MQQATVGTKYQIVIPKEVRKRMKGLAPGSKVTLNPISDKMLTVKIEPTDWVERTEGIMTEAWKNIDPIAELEKTRNEWEERLEEMYAMVKK